MPKEEKQVSLAVLNNLSTIEEFQVLLDSGAIPSGLDTPQKLMTVIQTGKELGMQAMTAINNIHVIKGRTVISAAILGAMLKERDIEYEYSKDWVTEKDSEGDDRIVTEITFTYLSKLTRKPKELSFEISWNEMVRAGYTDKDAWKKYPKNMMRARCMAYGVRALFPEILLGVYTDAEIVDSMKDSHHDVSVTEEGEVVVIQENSSGEEG